MRRFALCLSLVLAAVAVAIASGHFGKVNGAWKKDSSAREDFSRQEWAVIKTLSPLPALPVDTTNKYRDSPAAALLGQKLFLSPGSQALFRRVRLSKGNWAQSER